MLSLGVQEKYFAPSTRILGLDFAVDKSALGPTGQKRKDTAQKTLSRLQVLPMTRGFKEFLYRTSCQTIICWGCWMQGHDPEFDRSWNTQLKRILGAHRMASRALWTLLQGHWVSPTLTADIACVSHYIRIFKFLAQSTCFHPTWNMGFTCPNIMQKAGFAHISFGHFRHPIWGDSRFCMTQWKQTFKPWLINSEKFGDELSSTLFFLIHVETLDPSTPQVFATTNNK